MEVHRETDRIGTEIKPADRTKMRVLHSVTLSGAPLEQRLRVEYLKGGSSSMLVQTTVLVFPLDKQETKTWDLAALVNGDFEGGKLKGLKEYAEEIFPDAEKPVIIFRQIIIHQSENVFHLEPSRTSRAAALPVHSTIRQLGG